MTALLSRCPSCLATVTPERSGDYQVSPCCDEVTERVYLCVECQTRECHTGADICFECVLDESVADPRTIEMCAPALQMEIARGLAERLRPFLSRKQAA